MARTIRWWFPGLASTAAGAEAEGAAGLEDGASAAAGAEAPGAAGVGAADGVPDASAPGLPTLDADTEAVAFRASSFAGVDTVDVSLREDCSPRRRAKRLTPNATKRMMLIASGPARRGRGARSGRRGPWGAAGSRGAGNVVERHALRLAKPAQIRSQRTHESLPGSLRPG